MSELLKQKGMTLVSVLVAVALTSALAVAASKLISNQVKLGKIMELTDQRDMIARFYLALMHNRVVWRCTLYDPDNSSLLNCISDSAACTVSHVQLKTPDCKFKHEVISEGVKELHELTATHGTGDHYKSSGTFFTTNPMMLGNSMTEHAAAGWWETRLSANSVGKGSVDLVLTITFDEDNYKAAHAGFDPPDIRDRLTYRVRHGDPNVQGREEDCANSAVVTVDDLTAAGVRGITCSSDNNVRLVNVKSANARPNQHKGNFLHSLADGVDTRVGKNAAGTNDRTGLKIEDNLPWAIKDIKTDGGYELVPVNSKKGALGFGRKNACPRNAGVLSEITSAGSAVFDNHKGPHGVQGLPGTAGFWGEKGCTGAPAPPCPDPPPDCLSTSTMCGAAPPAGPPPLSTVSCPTYP